MSGAEVVTGTGVVMVAALAFVVTGDAASELAGAVDAGAVTGGFVGAATVAARSLDGAPHAARATTARPVRNRPWMVFIRLLPLVILRSVSDRAPAGVRLHITTLQWTTPGR